MLPGGEVQRFMIFNNIIIIAGGVAYNFVLD